MGRAAPRGPYPCADSDVCSIVSTVPQVAAHGFHPPRPVEVEHEGRWWSGLRSARRHDAGGWVADVEYTVAYDWGPGEHLAVVTADRVRLLGEG